MRERLEEVGLKDAADDLETDGKLGKEPVGESLPLDSLTKSGKEEKERPSVKDEEIKKFILEILDSPKVKEFFANPDIIDTIFWAVEISRKLAIWLRAKDLGKIWAKKPAKPTLKVEGAMDSGNRAAGAHDGGDDKMAPKKKQAKLRSYGRAIASAALGAGMGLLIYYTYLHLSKKKKASTSQE